MHESAAHAAMAWKTADAATSFWGRQQAAVVLPAGKVPAFHCLLVTSLLLAHMSLTQWEGCWRLSHIMGTTVQT